MISSNYVSILKEYQKVTGQPLHVRVKQSLVPDQTKTSSINQIYTCINVQLVYK